MRSYRRKIRYRAGFKYQLAETYTCETGILPDHPIATDFLRLNLQGLLTVKAGYAWDGPSGPTIDTKDFMRGSVVHDALYQFMRRGDLPLSCRDQADRLLRKMCLEDGMSEIRAWWVYTALKRAGESAALPENVKPIHRAP